MSTRRAHRLPLAMLLGLLILLVPTAALAQVPASSAAADAFGVFVSASPLQQEPIRVGPTPNVNVYEPPAEEPQSDEVAEIGPVPENGSLVQHVRAVKVTADGDVAAGHAVGHAETAGVSLLGGQVTADVLHAVSTTTCPGPNSITEASAGSQVVNLSIGGQEIPVTPEPNQVAIRVADETGRGIADVRVFEVIPDADGLGFTTRMLHVFTLDPITQVVNGEIIVAEAHSTVSCGGQETSAGPDNPIFITKDAEPGTVQAGDHVTYTINVTNQEDTATCTVFEVTDRLPPGFIFVGAGGGLADFDAEPETEGREVRFINPAGVALEPGQTLSGTLQVQVGADVAPGTYYNDVIVRSTCGVFEKGHDAPVTVTGPPAAGPEGPIDTAPPAAGPTLPATGPALPAMLGLMMLGAAGALRPRR